MKLALVYSIALFILAEVLLGPQMVRVVGATSMRPNVSKEEVCPNGKCHKASKKDKSIMVKDRPAPAGIERLNQRGRCPRYRYLC